MFIPNTCLCVTTFLSVNFLKKPTKMLLYNMP